MYGKWLKIADFITFDKKYQFLPLEIEKKDLCALSRHHPKIFQGFSNFHRIHRGITGGFSGADLAENQHFELRYPLECT